MKFSFTIIISILLLDIIFSQSISFDKEYEFGQFVQSGIVDIEGNIIFVSANHEKGVFLSKINFMGDLIWVKEFEELRISPNWKTNNILLCNDGGFVFSATVGDSVVLIKTDQYGNMLWQYFEELSDQQINFVGNLIYTEDHNFIFEIISQSKNTNPDYFKAYKISSTGFLLNQVKVENANSYSGKPLLELSNSNLLLFTPWQIIKLTKDLDVIWQKDIPNTYSISDAVFWSKDSILCLSSRDSLFYINEDGDYLGFVGKLSGITIIKTNNNEIITSDYNYKIRKYDSDFNIVNEISLSSSQSFYSFIEYNSGFIFFGRSNNKSNVMKVDENLFSNSLRILELHGVYSENIIWIHWSGINNSVLELEYSINNGESWEMISRNIPGNNCYYIWYVSGFEEECINFRINNISDQSVFSTFDNCYEISSDWNYDNYDVDLININSIKMWVMNNGISSNRKGTGGLFWSPKQFPSIMTSWSEGLILGGKINDNLRISGSYYQTSMQPGNVNDFGVPGEPSDSTFKNWKYRKDIESIKSTNLKERIINDKENWPVDIGAPFSDINNDGIYTSSIDSPFLKGDEYNWSVFNDFNQELTMDRFGTKPLGVEIQQSIYGFNTDNFLNDVLFKEYIIINKNSNDTIKDLYIGYWSDVDLGEYTDDLFGCDTSLNLGYVYNGSDRDVDIGNFSPPAIGYQIIKGPKSTQSGIDTKFLDANGNLNITATGGIARWESDFMRDAGYQKIIEWYNNLRGLLTGTGGNVINPYTGNSTSFVYTGDPESNDGWIDKTPGDKRAMINCGPFTMLPGEKQTIALAVLFANGNNRLNSVTELKNKARLVKEYYYQNLITRSESEKSIPKKFLLSQNYPNPFNPTTFINYSLAHSEKIKIVVYDILGREVKTLVNETQSAGNYKIEFDASNLSSGVYFYQLVTHDFVETKKMMLIK